MAKTITEAAWNTFKTQAQDRKVLHDSTKGLYFIKLRGGGSWRFRYTSPVDGKRVTATLGGPDMAPVKARALADTWRGRLSEGIDPRAEHQANVEQQRKEKAEQQNRWLVNTGTFFSEIYEPHLEESAGAGRNTVCIIKKNFERLFDRDMDSLTAADIEAWENWSKKKGNTRGTRQRALAAFKAMLAFAAGQKRGDPNKNPVIETNPLAGVTLAKKNKQERDADDAAEMNLKRDLLNAGERAQLQVGLEKFAQQIRQGRRNSRQHGKPHLPDLDAVPYPHWFIPFCHIARLTGMRPGDVRRLNWTDVQYDFRSNLRVLRYKPNKTSYLEDPVAVTFPITEELGKVIDDWRTQHGNPKSGYMFESDRVPGQPLGATAHHGHWNKVKKLAELERQDIHFYSFRHNFISDLVKQGTQTLRIAKLVGHRSPLMIEKHYFTEDLSDAAAMLEMLNAPSTQQPEPEPESEQVEATA